MNRTKIFNYIATAESETKNYTITVTNNWTNGRNELVKFNNPGAYAEVTCSWTNNSDSSITWQNINGDNINWENNTWV